MNDLISIIVPVYNVSAYLDRCMTSLLSQTYGNIEIILIDDGSTDGSGAICDKYAEKDDRIRVFHTENRGVSAARNLGIDKASGNFIMFADSDDWVDPGFCKMPYEAALEHSADCVMFQFYTVRQDQPKRLNRHLNEGPVDKNSAIDLMLFSGLGWIPCNKLYKTELFSGIRYPEGRWYEDTATTHKLLLNASKICIIDTPLYYYVKDRAGSITMSQDCKHIKDFLDMNRQRGNELREFGYPQENIDYYDVEAALVYLMHTKKEKTDEDREWSVRVLKETKVLNSGHSNMLSNKRRALIKLFKFSPSLFDLACFLIGKKSAS